MIALVSLFLAVASIPATGFVATKLWAWFVTPEFGDASPSILFFVGLSLLVTMFKGPREGTGEVEQEVVLARAVASLTIPLFVLSLGWIIYSLFGGAQ